MAYIIFFFLLFTTQGLFALREDYYWREYTGSVPVDAIIGGQDINGNSIYIGQAYVQGQGLIVSEIFPGVREVQAPIYGIKKVSSYIKVLCGNQSNFYWTPIKFEEIHTQLINKRPVIGGHEPGGVLFVGRSSYEGELKIGKVASFQTKVHFYFNNKGTEKRVESYEVLVFNGKNVDVGNFMNQIYKKYFVAAEFVMVFNKKKVV